MRNIKLSALILTFILTISCITGCGTASKVIKQIELGGENMTAGNYVAAIDAYSAAISLDQYSVEGYTGLIQAMNANGSSQEEINAKIQEGMNAIAAANNENKLSEKQEAVENFYLAASELQTGKEAINTLKTGLDIVSTENSALQEKFDTEVKDLTNSMLENKNFDEAKDIVDSFIGEGTEDEELKNLYDDVTNKVNDPEELYKIGVDFYEADNPDYEKAIEYWEKAAELGYIIAYIELGNIYSEGYADMPVDYEKALLYYEKAANQDNVLGIREMGKMYYYGNGVPEDHKKAFSYYKKAADMGDVVGIRLTGYFYLIGDGTEIDYDKGFEYTQKASELNDAVAWNNLGYCYGNGWGCERNVDKCIEAVEKSIELGYEPAVQNLKDIKKSLNY